MTTVTIYAIAYSPKSAVSTILMGRDSYDSLEAATRDLEIFGRPEQSVYSMEFSVVQSTEPKPIVPKLSRRI